MGSRAMRGEPLRDATSAHLHHRRVLLTDGQTMSENIRAAHARIKRHCKAKQQNGSRANKAPDEAASARDALLADLGRLPAPGSASKVFVLGENEIGLPGVSLWVRSEEQPYLRGAINAIECLIEAHGLEALRSRGVSCQRGSMAFAVGNTEGSGG